MKQRRHADAGDPAGRGRAGAGRHLRHRDRHRAEHLPRIFDPFFTTKGDRSGAGLGLSFVHRTVEDHGGTIKVESSVGGGTTFLITFPADEGRAHRAMTPPAPRRSGWIAAAGAGCGALITAAVVVSRRHLAARRPSAVAAADGPAAPIADAGTFQVTRRPAMVEAGRNGALAPDQERRHADPRGRGPHGGRRAARRCACPPAREVELREKVEIGLDRLPSGATVDLRHGKVFARVSGSDGLEINAHDTRTANDGPAHFVVMSDDNGQVSVAALTGRARFSAGGKSLSVSAGSETSSVAGGPPRIPNGSPKKCFWTSCGLPKSSATPRPGVRRRARRGVDQGDDQRHRRRRGPRRPVHRVGSAARRQEHPGRRGRGRHRAHAPRHRRRSCAAAPLPR